MSCEVFKIVNNIAPSVIQNLTMLKCSQYSMRKDNTAVVPKYVCHHANIMNIAFIVYMQYGYVYNIVQP